MEIEIMDKNIKRYDLDYNGEKVGMFERKDGIFVLYSDIKQLEEELDRAIDESNRVALLAHDTMRAKNEECKEIRAQLARRGLQCGEEMMPNYTKEEELFISDGIAQLEKDNTELRAQLARCVYVVEEYFEERRHGCPADELPDVLYELKQLPKQAKLVAEVLECAYDFYDVQNDCYEAQVYVEKALIEAVRAAKE